MEAHGSKAAQQQTCEAKQRNVMVASSMDSDGTGDSDSSEAMAATAGQRWQQAASARASARSGTHQRKSGRVAFTGVCSRQERRDSAPPSQTQRQDAATGDGADEAAASAPARRMESARARRQTGQ